MSGLRRWVLVALIAFLTPSTTGAVDQMWRTTESEAPTASKPSPSQAPGELSGVVDADRYSVGPGDQFAIWIWGPITRSIPVVVGPEGDALIPEIGSVNLAGRTLREARAMLSERVRRSLRNVEVDVRLIRLRTFRVYVTGSVTHPGPLLATGASRVADVLADSILAPGASRRNIEVIRTDGSMSTVDLLRFQLAGESSEEPWLREGDVIHVPVATKWLGVWGAVGRPGTFELGPHDSLGSALKLGGGLLPSALADGVRLVRWRDHATRESLTVRIEGGSVAEPAVALQDGDQLFVLARPGYHESQRVTLVGRVPREGAFPITLGVTRITDVLRAAGGFLDDADRSSVHLFRRVSGDGDDPEFARLLRLSRSDMTESEYESFRSRLAAQSTDIRVDWTLLESGRSDLDLIMQDGDVIRVERRITAVRVDGQVRRPGLIPFTPGKPHAYYIRLAGGLTRRAAHTQIRLTRAGSGQIMMVRDAGTVWPGDQLWVPERPDIAPWQYVRDGLVVAAQLATVWLAVRK